MTAAADPALQQALAESPIEPELYEQLLSDTRAALFQGSLRRAILELAISCEVAIKQAFFDKATEAALSPYFDEKRQVSDSVGGFTNLLGEPAERILGQNFRKADRRACIYIHHLFQCRNQIAHEGQPTYKNQRGHDRPVDQAVAKYRSSKKSIQIPSDLLAIYGRRGQPSQCDIGHLIVTRCT